MKAKSILPSAIVIFALLAQVTFAALPRYEIIDLGRFFVSDNSFAINNSGQVAGSSSLWENGVITELGTLGGWYTLAHGINDAGQVVGHSHTAPSATAPYRAFLWENDIMKAVEPIVDRSVAYGINDLGQIVGLAGGGAVLWENGTMTSLGVPWSDARDINNSGDVVGQSNWRAFLWKAGMMIDLGTLGGLYSCAEGINDSGEVVGWAQTPGGDYHAFVWKNGVMVDISTLEGTGSCAYGINSRGQVVGGAATADGDWAAFIWQDGIMTNLNDLIPADCNVFLGGVDAEEVYIGINDAGQIACHNNYTGESYLLLPFPRTIYVDDDATGANDGSSWADAFNYLQDALAAAWSGDEIRVAEGIYTPDSNSANTNGSVDRTATFQLINGVTIKGGYAGTGTPDPNARDIDGYKTILSGDLYGNDADVNELYNLLDEPTRAENSCHVVTGSGTEKIAVLDGFAITGGQAHDVWPNYGGGMYNEYGNPTVLNCTFSGNAAIRGGGMYNYFSNTLVTNCIFSGNWAVEGGGMSNNSGSPTLTSCTFEYNSAQMYGGMFNLDSNPTLINCVFVNNSAEFDGAGICNVNGSSRLTSCMFTRNSSVDGSGGAICNYMSSLMLTNCIFSRNYAFWDGHAINDVYGALALTNCILWDHPGSEISSYEGRIVISYSDVQYVPQDWLAKGNIKVNPCFVDPNSGDYHLLSDSPCINAGAPNYVAEPNETDLDGRPRVIGGRIDMGAYEYSRSIRIVPRTINLASEGKWITCYIWLPEGDNVADIDPNSVFLEDEIKPEDFSVDEQQQVATARFSREKVQSILNIGDIELTITCQLTDGTYFEAKDIVQVTDKGGGKSSM